MRRIYHGPNGHSAFQLTRPRAAKARRVWPDKTSDSPLPRHVENLDLGELLQALFAQFRADAGELGAAERQVGL